MKITIPDDLAERITRRAGEHRRKPREEALLLIDLSLRLAAASDTPAVLPTALLADLRFLSEHAPERFVVILSLAAIEAAKVRRPMSETRAADCKILPFGG